MEDGGVAPAAKIRIAGAWTGSISVDLATWTLPMLKSEVASRAGLTSLEFVNLICAGRVLKDCGGDGEHLQSLKELGLKDNAKVLATAVTHDRGKSINDEAERAQKLSRIRDAADALARRHSDGSMPLEDFSMEIENQDGQKLKIGTEMDQKGVMVGLMLHARGKSLIKIQAYKDALDVLSMAEEAFSICDAKIIEIVDNVPILQLDVVWCYFMLRDISCLSVAGARLQKVRKGFERAHGKDFTRFRLLQEGRHADLAIYVRLEVLEGVVAYHCGNFELSRKALNSAQTKYSQLQVPDEALSLLLSMGYRERAAKRALRMSCQDIQAAVDFLVEERAKAIRRREEDVEHRKEIKEQKEYGKTPLNKAVDMTRLKALVSTIGFEKCLAAEALRLSENDLDKALDLLTDTEKNCELQRKLEASKRQKTMRPTNEDIEEMVSMGYERSQVMSAVNNSHTRDEALELLQSTNSRDDQQANASPAGDNAGSSDKAAESKEERDEDMEDELAREITGDALADYDLDLTKEGEAILEYLALLDSATSLNKGTLQLS